MVLEAVWFFLWGLLWAVYFMTDGFDLGIGSLLPILGKSEEDKKVMVNSTGHKQKKSPYGITNPIPMPYNYELLF